MLVVKDRIISRMGLKAGLGEGNHKESLLLQNYYLFDLAIIISLNPVEMGAAGHGFIGTSRR